MLSPQFCGRLAPVLDDDPGEDIVSLAPRCFRERRPFGRPAIASDQPSERAARFFELLLVHQDSPSERFLIGCDEFGRAIFAANPDSPRTRPSEIPHARAVSRDFELQVWGSGTRHVANQRTKSSPLSIWDCDR